MEILLVEPAYRNKYPPLGLMKISSYHKRLNDNVFFVKGKNKDLRGKKWDRIYISTLFTFHWKSTIDTIKYYLKSVNDPASIFIGGVMATLMDNKIKAEKGLENITIKKGLLNSAGMLDENEYIVDTMIPDYSIISKETNPLLNYQYKVTDSYIAYTTRGCIRRCDFCAVHKIEPQFCNYVDIREQINYIKENYGEKRHLMLMDNNVLASTKIDHIISDLIDLGYGRGNKSYKKNVSGKERALTRYVDFNQGVDGRLLTKELMQKLAKLEIRPLRIAFDHADDENVAIYVSAVRLAAQYGVKTLSNYILFNFVDEPKDLYKRLEINLSLNNEFIEQDLVTSIWSFPMKYSPIEGEHCTDRKYIGDNWNAKLLRGIQCVLNATHGVVGTKMPFFRAAFGENYDDFIATLYMPENYIINRKASKEEIGEWKTLYFSLDDNEKNEFIEAITSNSFDSSKVLSTAKLQDLYSRYF